MDVTASCFNRLLPRILNDIAESRFVALDLEFSGIAGKEHTTTQVPFSDAPPDRSLQNRYNEVRAAAEKFTVLQLGLTFIRHDANTGQFVLRPYNFHLNPLLNSKIGIEREWTCQSSSMEFLFQNGFHIEESFRNGVRYLSRDEEARALALQAERERQRETLADIKPENMSMADVAFVVEVRRMIDDWLDSMEQEAHGESEEEEANHYLNIPPPCVPEYKRDIMPEILNGYQKRLVHQTVRKHYPSYTSRGENTFVQITPLDEERERLVQKERKEYTRQRVNDHIGLRWIFEALVGGDLTSLPLVEDCQAVTGDGASEELTKEDLSELKETLLSKLSDKGRQRPVLVGHNIFADLIYLYSCFLGELPLELEEFHREVHSLFPMVVDTKFLATRTQAHANAQNSSLREIIKSLNDVSDDRIMIDMEYGKYNLNKIQHEAGYDSFMTAQIFLKLVTKLYAEEKIEEPQKAIETNEPSITDPFDQPPLQKDLQGWDDRVVHKEDVLKYISHNVTNTTNDNKIETNTEESDLQLILAKSDTDEEEEEVSCPGSTANNYDTEGEDERSQAGSLKLINFDSDEDIIRSGYDQVETKKLTTATNDDLIDFESPSPVAPVRMITYTQECTYENDARSESRQTPSSTTGRSQKSPHDIPFQTRSRTNSSIEKSSLALHSVLSQKIETETHVSQSKSSSTSTKRQIRKPVWENNDDLGWGNSIASVSADASASRAWEEDWDVPPAPWEAQGDHQRRSSQHSTYVRQLLPSAWDVEEVETQETGGSGQSVWNDVENGKSFTSCQLHSAPGTPSHHKTSEEGDERPDWPTSDTDTDDDEDSETNNQSSPPRIDISIPESGHPIWALFMNKLRVYGTDEEIFDLGDPPRSQECDVDAEEPSAKDERDDDDVSYEGMYGHTSRTPRNPGFANKANVRSTASIPSVLTTRTNRTALLATKALTSVDLYEDDLWRER